MTYDLAKQLKDAGFTGARLQTCFKDHYHIANCDYLPDPTLSELIEACGDDFAFLAKSDDGSEWVASALNLPLGWNGNTEAKGIAPEEAVANLWLALRKK